MVMAPVNSSACAVTSGTSRHKVPLGTPRVPSQKVGVVSGADWDASWDSSASPALTSEVLVALLASGCCHDGICHDSDAPPPPLPQLAPSFQTCSVGGCVASSMVVPP